MPSRYFFGRSVKTNLVRASTAHNFRTLVQHHLEGIIRLHHTQQEYLALKDKKARLDAKDTHYLVACTYPGEEAERNRENALDCCNLLFLDMDVEADGTCPAAPFVRNKDILHKKLEPFNFAAYTTASSTEALPRMRIVVEASGIPLSSYPDAVRSVALLLGLHNVTKESLIPNQPMICPTLFRDQDEDFDHPLLATSFKGRGFMVSDIAQDTITLTKQHKVAGPLDPADGEDDGLEYLRAPLMGLSLEKVSEALRHLDPDMPYPEWFDVAAALRHQFSADQAEEAYALFDKWSSGEHGRPSTKYTSGDDTLAKWNSVKPTPRGRVPVTIRTLIKRASDAGWSAGALKDECFDAVADWICHSAQTREELTWTALERIAGLPLLSSTEEELLLNLIITQMRETRKETISKTSLRKDLKKIQSARERSKEGAAPVQEHPWTKGWCYVTSSEEFFRHTSHQRMSGEALNSAFGRYLLPTAEQLEKSGKEVTDGTLNTPLFFPKEYLLHHKQCLVVDGYDYDPVHPKDIYTEDASGVRLVNTYRQCYAKPDPTRARKAGDVLMEHLTNLIIEPEYRIILLDYIAYMVQFPGRKIRWCPLIQGAEGCGKTLMARLLEAVLGPNNVSLVNNDAIRSQWNDWAFGSQVVVIPEAYVSGKGRMETMNRLKDLVTDDRISINKRATSTRTVVNRSNYLMFTNHHDALVLMVGSRRYFIIKSRLQTEEQVTALGPDYFDRMFNLIGEEAPGLRAFFETWDIASDFPADGRAPKTKYLEEMIEDAANQETAVMRRLLREGGDPLIQEDLVASIRLASTMELEGVHVTPQALGAMLRDASYRKVSDSMINGERDHLWVKSGCLTDVKDYPALARHRLETNYKPEQEDWV